jgi:tetratricopeptide (TPR) repeat protein
MIIHSKAFEEIFDRGINYFRAGFYSSALSEFAHLKRVCPDYPNIDHTIEATRKKNAEVNGQLTNIIEDNFDDEIIALSDELVIEDSSNLGSKVRSLLANGKYSQALETLKKAQEIVPDSRPLLMMLGNTYRRLGQLKEAEKTLLYASRLFPEDADVLNNLGNVYLLLGMYNDAENYIRAALRLSPNNAKLFNNLGSLRMQTHNLDDAERLFRKALSLDSSQKVLAKNLRNLQFRMESLDEEIERLREDYFLHPTYLDIGLTLAKTLFFRGFHAESKSVLLGLLKKNSGLVNAWFYLATIYDLVSDTENACHAYEQLVIHSGRDGTSEYLSYQQLMGQGFVDEALVEIKKVAILELDVASSRINLGIKYFEDCLWEEALGHFDEAIEMNDSYPDAFYWKGLALLQLKKNPLAKKNLLKAIELNPKYADAHFQMGLILRSSARRKSKDHLKKALEFNLRPSFARIAKRIIGE